MLLALGTAVALAWLYFRPPVSGSRASVWFRTRTSTPLNLRVEPQGDGVLLVRWNAIGSAKFATLQIDDGSEHRNLRLDSNQIGHASILYSPGSKDLSFRLDVFDGKGSPTSDSLRVVNGSSSTLVAHTVPIRKSPPSAKVHRGQNSPGSPAPVLDARITAATSTKKPAAIPGQSRAASSIVRPVTRRIREPERNTEAIRNRASIDYADSAVGRPSPKAQSSADEPELRKPRQALPSTRSSGSSAEPQVTNNVEGNTSLTYVPPRPLKQVMPRATNSESAGPSAAIDIQIEVTIDDEGRVTDARVANYVGNSSKDKGPLTSAALAAAQEWVFEPAKAHGKSIPSHHRIVFRFGQQVEHQ